MKRPKLNWNPKRRGEIYCSSACGAGCRWSDYLAAKRIGDLVKKTMDNPSEWTVSVWENFGWHWKLVHVKGHLSIYPDSHGVTIPSNFHASLSTDEDALGCDATWYDGKRFSNPNDAVKHRLKLASDVMKGVNKLLYKFNLLRLK